MPKAKASKTTSDSSAGRIPDNMKALILSDKSTSIPGFKPFADAKERGFTSRHNDGSIKREVLQSRSGPSDIWVDVRSKARKKKK